MLRLERRLARHGLQPVLISTRCILSTIVTHPFNPFRAAAISNGFNDNIVYGEPWAGAGLPLSAADVRRRTVQVWPAWRLPLARRRDVVIPHESGLVPDELSSCQI
jgi:hypothetical protein